MTFSGDYVVLSSPIGELLYLTLKIFVLVRVRVFVHVRDRIRPRTRPRICPRTRPRVIWFFRTITLESLNQSEPNFHT